jgi:tRNA A-37 threonylcarbamoyl transferase component Bud32
MNNQATNVKRELIGEGRIAKVYLEDGYAYKCFKQTHPIDWITYEVNIQNEVAKKTKLPVLSYTFTDNPYEIKMPYINGIELTDRMRKHKYKSGVEDLIDLQKQVFAYENLNLPHAHDVFKHTLETAHLDEKLRHIGLEALASIERKNVLCHLDFHFSNIMFDGKKYFIIDWVNAKLGNSVLDIARTYVILVQYAYRLSGKYLKMIAKDLKMSLDSFEKPIKLMAILRMLEMSDEETSQRLLDLINN